MATAPYQAELLQLLRQRDAELAKLREERQHKETTIDFLKTKIVTLQNQNRAALSERPEKGPGAQDLQLRLNAALEQKAKALQRQQELDVQLQHSTMEVADLRQELTQARAEVARLEAEMETLRRPTAMPSDHGGSKATDVLMAVEELERELAQDVSHLEQVTCDAESVEKAPGESVGTTESAPPVEERPVLEEDEKMEGTATSATSRVEVLSSPEVVEVPTLAIPEERDVLLGSMASVMSQDSPIANGGLAIRVSATGALINFFDSEDAATLEAKRQRMARQIERRRQARRHLGDKSARRPSATSVTSATSAASIDASEEATTLTAEKGEKGAVASKVPEVKLQDLSGGSVASASLPTLPAWVQSPREAAQTARSHGSVRPGEIMDPNDPQRRSLTSSRMEVRGDSAVAPPGKGGATPTLHSKFEGLRDEMKRRRSGYGRDGREVESETAVASPEAPNVGVVSEVDGSRRSVAPITEQPRSEPPTAPPSAVQTARTLAFGVSPGASPCNSPMLRSRTLRVTGNAARSQSMSFTPLSRSSNHVTHVGHGTTSPQSAVRGMTVVSAGGPTHGGRADDGGWRMRPGQASSVLVAPGSLVTSPCRQPSTVHHMTWREEKSNHGSHVAAPPGELDRSRRNLTVSAQRISLSSSCGTLAPGSATHGASPQSAPTVMERGAFRPPEACPIERDEVHEAVLRFASTQSLRFPLARTSKGIYTYGTKKLLMTMHNSKLMVRTGGGFATLESCIQEAEKNTRFPPGPQLVVNASSTDGRRKSSK